MRITDIEAVPLVKKLETPFEGGTYRVVNRCTIVTRVTTSNGTMGEIFGGDEDIHQMKIIEIINKHLRPALLGESILNYEKLWSKMFQVGGGLDLGNRSLHALDMSNRGIIMEAISAVDNVIWDTIGKVHNQSVCSLLGGSLERMPVIAIGGYYKAGKSNDDLMNEIAGYEAQGLKGVKMKVGRMSPAADADRVRAVRKVIGKDFALICDANQAWDLHDAVRFCELVRDVKLTWLEEPIAWYDQFEGRMSLGD